MEYKVIKEFVSTEDAVYNIGDTILLNEVSDLTELLKLNGFIEEIKEGKFKDGDTYRFTDSCGMVYECNWVDDNADNFRLSQNNAFHTREEAEEYLKYLKAKAVLRADTKGHRFAKGRRNYLVRRTEDRILEITYFYYKTQLGQFYFATEEDVKNSNATHAEEWHLVFNYELKNGA